MGNIPISNSHVFTLVCVSSNCDWSVQCCALSRSSWSSSHSVMLCIALNSLVYRRRIGIDMSG